MNSSFTNDKLDVALIRGSSANEPMTVCGQYNAVCLDKEGNVKWEENFDNLVTDQGKQHLLDLIFNATPSATSFVRMSLFTAGTPAATWTYAVPVYTEVASGVVAARGTPSFSAASGSGTVSKATSSAVSFAIIGPATITGAAINVVNGAVGNLGVSGDTATANAKLYSAGTFSSSKAVSNGDTLNVTYTTQLN